MIDHPRCMLMPGLNSLHITLLYGKNKKQHFLYLPCCSNRAFCFFKSSMSCWWVWFFRLMYWMYSVALSRICAREACLTEFCQQKFQRAMGQCGVYFIRVKQDIFTVNTVLNIHIPNSFKSVLSNKSKKQNY